MDTPIDKKVGWDQHANHDMIGGEGGHRHAEGPCCLSEKNKDCDPHYHHGYYSSCYYYLESVMFILYRKADSKHTCTQNYSSTV